MANLTFDFLHNYVTGERRASDPADAYQYDEGHVLEAVVPVAVTSCEIQYWIRGMEKADAYTPTSITQNTDNTYTILGNIPNSYFETNGDLRVYIVVTDGDASITTYEGYIHIKERQMPEDYVDDDPDNEAVRVIAAARGYAETSEAWAVGQINGEDVPSTADQYQNNASYYAGQAASAASSAAAQASLAPAYDNTATYAVGDYCLHDGQLYECTTAIATAEAWTAAHWTAVTVGGELSTLKEDITPVPTSESNIYRMYEHGTGYYEVSSGRPTFYNYSSYRYSIMKVDPNSIYYWNWKPVAWILTDDNGTVISYKNMNQATPAFFVETGTATKLYYTISASYDPYIVVSKGIYGTDTQKNMPPIISNINQNNCDAKYGCALPKKRPYITVGMAEKWYIKNILAIPSNVVNFGVLLNVWSNLDNEGLMINATSAQNNTNGYSYKVYDDHYSLISQVVPTEIYSKAKNLASCSALVIGDSTVAQNTMTQKMLDAFSADGKTLTLLGTKGTSPNLHEGRAGWSLKNYCTESTNNPFYNSSTGKFDFSYYMSGQGYASVDFVVVQLGINDLYNADFDDFEATKVETAGYLIDIINSILAFNPTQKVIINLPTAVNDDQSRHTQLCELVRNKFIRYNEYALLMLTQFNIDYVRPSHCHLILDPASDINDDVHPNVSGYTKMANEVVSQINCFQN